MATPKTVVYFQNEVVTETANCVRDAVTHAAVAAQDVDTLKKALIDMLRTQGGWVTRLSEGEAQTTYRIETTKEDVDGDGDVVTIKDGNVVQVQFKLATIRLTMEQVETLSEQMGTWFNSFFESSETVDGVNNPGIVLEWINKTVKDRAGDFTCLSASASGIMVLSPKGEHIPGVTYGKAWTTKSGLLDIIREVPKDIWEGIREHMEPLVLNAVSSAVTTGDHAVLSKKGK